VPKIRLPEQDIPDFAHVDHNWPGLHTYLQENNYDMSKLGTNGRLDRVMSMILDTEAENTEECEYFRFYLSSRALRSFRRRVSCLSPEP